MTMLQLLAAEAAGVERLVFHTVRTDGVATAGEGQARIRKSLGTAPLVIEEALERIAALGLAWGMSNGT